MNIWGDYMLDYRSGTVPLLSGKFGLERETLRVCPDGFTSQEKHPFPILPEVDRDFCENQVEIITPVCSSIEALYDILDDIHTSVTERLLHLEGGPEYLWPFSNPPYIRQQSAIPIAAYEGDNVGKTAYREYLAVKYGRRKMAYSGIHYNYSFDEGLLREQWSRGSTLSFPEYKNQVYLNLAAGLFRFSWLVVFLTAASPVFDESLEWDGAFGTDRFDHYASRRNSEIGYWNDFVPFLNYSTVDSYVDSIQALVGRGLIRASSELYIPIRIKPKGANTLENLQRTGIDHIELRMLDLNPLTRLSIRKEDLYFLHYLLLYLASWNQRPFTDDDQVRAVVNQKRAAKYEMKEIFVVHSVGDLPIEQAVSAILDEISGFYQELGTSEAEPYINFQRQKVQNNENRYAVQVFHRYHHDYVPKGVELARSYAGIAGKNRE